jgi:hypothetical protein
MPDVHGHLRNRTGEEGGVNRFGGLLRNFAAIQRSWNALS